MTKKSEITQFELSFTHPDAQALAASLITECKFVCEKETVDTNVISASSSQFFRVLMLQLCF